MFRPKEKKRIITCTVHVRKEKREKRGGVSERESEKRVREDEERGKREEKNKIVGIYFSWHILKLGKMLKVFRYISSQY